MSTSTPVCSRSLLRITLAATLLAAVPACSAANTAAPTHANTVAVTILVTASVSSIATTTNTSSTTTTITTTTITTATRLPVIYTGVLRDVVVAASLAEVPADTPVSAARHDESPLYTNGCHVGWSATVPKDRCDQIRAG